MDVTTTDALAVAVRKLGQQTLLIGVLEAKIEQLQTELDQLRPPAVPAESADA